jgi:hypothetical protein
VVSRLEAETGSTITAKILYHEGHEGKSRSSQIELVAVPRIGKPVEVAAAYQQMASSDPPTSHKQPAI